MPFHIEYKLAFFTPRLAGEITGVSGNLQRDWRRRGFMSPYEGHARFTVFDLARLMFMKAAAERGMGPTTTERVADWVMNGIALAALSEPGAIFGGSEGIPGNPISVVMQHSPLGPEASRVLPGRHLVLWADGSEYWHPDVGAAFQWAAAQPDAEARLAGPVVVIDQTSLGRRLYHRAGTALAEAFKVQTK